MKNKKKLPLWLAMTMAFIAIIGIIIFLILVHLVTSDSISKEMQQNQSYHIIILGF